MTTKAISDNGMDITGWSQKLDPSDVIQFELDNAGAKPHIFLNDFKPITTRLDSNRFNADKDAMRIYLYDWASGKDILLDVLPGIHEHKPKTRAGLVEVLQDD